MPGPLTPRHKGTVYWRWSKISSLLLRVFRLSVNMSDLVWTQWRVDACTRRGSEWVRPPNARLHTVRTIGEFRRGQHQNGAGGDTNSGNGGLENDSDDPEHETAQEEAVYKHPFNSDVEHDDDDDVDEHDTTSTTSTSTTTTTTSTSTTTTTTTTTSTPTTTKTLEACLELCGFQAGPTLVPKLSGSRLICPAAEGESQGARTQGGRRQGGAGGAVGPCHP
jgi:hypothetical protein